MPADLARTATFDMSVNGYDIDYTDRLLDEIMNGLQDWSRLIPVIIPHDPSGIGYDRSQVEQLFAHIVELLRS